MGFRGSVESALRQYATFRGRASRSEYWWFVLFAALVSVAATILDAAAGSRLIASLTSLALLLPSLALTVRRLHDGALSGWWTLICQPLVTMTLLPLAVGVPVVAGSSDGVTSDSALAAAGIVLVVGGLHLLVSAILNLVFMLRRSTPGPNRFGPNPQGIGGDTPYGGQYGQSQPGPYPGRYGGAPDRTE